MVIGNDTLTKHVARMHSLLQKPVDPSLVDAEYTEAVIHRFFSGSKRVMVWHYIKMIDDPVCCNTIKHWISQVPQYDYKRVIQLVGHNLPIAYLRCVVCGNIIFSDDVNDKYCSAKCGHSQQSRTIKGKWDSGEFHHQDKLRRVAPENCRRFYETSSQERIDSCKQAIGKAVSQNHKNGVYEHSYEILADFQRNIHENDPIQLAIRSANMRKVCKGLDRQRKKNGNAMIDSEVRFYELLKSIYPDVILHTRKFYNLKIGIRYIPDFYLEDIDTIIEFDGSSHKHCVEHDRRRDEYFISIGVRTVRIIEEEFDKLELEDKISYIKEKVYGNA